MHTRNQTSVCKPEGHYMYVCLSVYVATKKAYSLEF